MTPQRRQSDKDAKSLLGTYMNPLLLGTLLLSLAGLGISDHFMVRTSAEQLSTISSDVKTLLSDNAQIKQQQADGIRERDQIETKLNELNHGK